MMNERRVCDCCGEEWYGYDFEGSMLPGAEESYRQFATEQAPYFVIYKNYVKNPILREVINRHFGFN